MLVEHGKLNLSEQLLVSEYLWERLATIADKDYIAARMLYLTNFPRQYCWSACQCIEKYTKALCLLDGRSAKFNHNFVGRLKSLINDGIVNLPERLSFSPPTLLNVETLNTLDLLNEFETQGSAGNRYGAKNFRLRKFSLQFLDIIVFELRRSFFEYSNTSVEVKRTTTTMDGRSHASVNEPEILGSLCFRNEINSFYEKHNFAFFPDSSAEEFMIKSEFVGRRHKCPEDISIGRFNQILDWIEDRMK